MQPCHANFRHANAAIYEYRNTITGLLSSQAGVGLGGGLRLGLATTTVGSGGGGKGRRS